MSAAGMLPMELQVKRSSYLAYPLVIVLTFGLAIPVLISHGRLFAKAFDQEGVIRRDKRKFLWIDLKKVDFVYKRSRYTTTTRLTQVHLIFPDGKAIISPRSLVNEKEVMEFIAFLAEKK